MSSSTKPFTYKVILVGNPHVGKTAAAACFAQGKPNTTTQYKSTVGVDFALREVQVSAGTSVGIQIWDIAGEQRFGTMTKTFFRGAMAAIIMFDLTNIVSWEDVDIWRKDIEDKLNFKGSKSNVVPIVIVGNKTDLVDLSHSGANQCVSDSTVNSYIAKHECLRYIKVSARTDTLFSEMVEDLAKMIHAGNPAVSVVQRNRANSTLKLLPKTSSLSSSTVDVVDADAVPLQLESENPKDSDDKGCCIIN